MADVYYIPDGPKNLSALFPQVDWTKVQEYYIEVQTVGALTLATSVINVLDTCCERGARIHFVNYAGAIDSVDMKITDKEHEAKSTSYQQPSVYPQDKTRHSVSRSNVKAADTYRVSTVDYGESEMTWLDELLDTPAAWIEWIGIQGQSNSYLPILIVDGKKQNKKLDDRYEYEVTIDFVMSNARVLLRN